MMCRFICPNLYSNRKLNGGYCRTRVRIPLALLKFAHIRNRRGSEIRQSASRQFYPARFCPAMPELEDFEPPASRVVFPCISRSLRREVDITSTITYHYLFLRQRRTSKDKTNSLPRRQRIIVTKYFPSSSKVSYF